MPRGLWLAVFGVLGLALVVGVGLAVHRLTASGTATPSPQVLHERHGMYGPASWAPGARPAPPITGLTDQFGRPLSLSSLHGHAVAIVFFDSHCHAECPLEGRALAAAERALPRAQRPVLVAVSVNPLDSRASVAAAVRAWGLASLAPWYWMMGTHRQLRPIWRAYHIYVGAAMHGDIAHTEAVYLVDKRGYERSGYLWPFMPRFVRHDLRQLATGPSRGA
jgi:cytochrome oxidase Cu insertion factor (SCO1/SenC/PrrC family)